MHPDMRNMSRDISGIQPTAIVESPSRSTTAYRAKAAGSVPVSVAHVAGYGGPAIVRSTGWYSRVLTT